MKFGSLFSGIGVFDTAAQAAGMSVEFGCDNHPFCKFWYEEHFPNAAFYGDIKTLDTIPYVDVLAFGFPCQDASLANSKKINNPLEGERTGLYYEAIRIINNSAKRPRWLVIENVPRILTHSGHAVFQELSKSGYNAGWAILPACAFGALHRRERSLSWLTPTKSDGVRLARFYEKSLKRLTTKKREGRKWGGNCIEQYVKIHNKKPRAEFLELLMGLTVGYTTVSEQRLLETLSITQLRKLLLMQ